MLLRMNRMDLKEGKIDDDDDAETHQMHESKRTIPSSMGALTFSKIIPSPSSSTWSSTYIDESMKWSRPTAPVIDPKMIDLRNFSLSVAFSCQSFMFSLTVCLAFCSVMYGILWEYCVENRINDLGSIFYR